MAAVAANTPIDTTDIVTMCTPEYTEVARWAQDHGFAMYDYDSFCATPGVELPGDLQCLNPGLA